MTQSLNNLRKILQQKTATAKIVQGIQKVSDWAKENPGKASIAVGILQQLLVLLQVSAGGKSPGRFSTTCPKKIVTR